MPFLKCVWAIEEIGIVMSTFKRNVPILNMITNYISFACHVWGGRMKNQVLHIAEHCWK